MPNWATTGGRETEDDVSDLSKDGTHVDKRIEALRTIHLCKHAWCDCGAHASDVLYEESKGNVAMKSICDQCLEVCKMADRAVRGRRSATDRSTRSSSSPRFQIWSPGFETVPRYAN